MSITEKTFLKFIVRLAVAFVLLVGMSLHHDAANRSTPENTARNNGCFYKGKAIDHKFCDPTWIASHQKFIKSINGTDNGGN
jgi:hypothetical protein